MTATAEKKAMLEKICTHQLEGLMFHFDYACIAKLLGHEKMACMQHKQAMKETEKQRKKDSRRKKYDDMPPPPPPAPKE